MEWLVWTITIVLMLCGVAGTVLPVLPGLSLIWLAVLFHKLMLPQVLSWWTVGLLFLGVAAGFLVDWMSGLLAAKWLGSTRYGLIGAFLGGLVGLFFGLPGLLVGPLIGALLGELIFSRRGLKASTRVAAGVGIGIVAASLIRLGIAVLMVLAFVLNVLLK